MSELARRGICDSWPVANTASWIQSSLTRFIVYLFDLFAHRQIAVASSLSNRIQTDEDILTHAAASSFWSKLPA